MRRIKYYGRLVKDHHILTNEVIEQTVRGVRLSDGHYRCAQCHSTQSHHFYTYQPYLNEESVTYCRNCIQLGKMESDQDVFYIKSEQAATDGAYHLPFNLSEQQSYASAQIVKAIASMESLLLYAVTGAGKTEMIFEGIKYARQLGLNVAVVSPRVDVVIEVALRIKEAFKNEQIDVLYQGHKQVFNGHFVISTIHQLFRFKSHFDVIFVDEVDAFPLSMDKSLQQSLIYASKATHSHLLMTATPPKKLLRSFKNNQIITLPARFHRKRLPVPQYQYFKLNTSKCQSKLLHILKEQVRKNRYTLVFFNHIRRMEDTYVHYKPHIKGLITVFSEDALRHDKVEALRRGEHSVVFTTTILERGFTMASLDVIVVDSHLFQANALVQIAGRVGRKKEMPTGLVLFLHEGISLSMLKASRMIKSMNRLGIERGWIDA
ncbi:DEAD/DEAH box helicase family protein [Staphylococcus massiliensis]|uniref:Putative ATP-dependent helicase n=1 Tax=Staphylococcus massiliensis S46 TaxID=1229783 RepID=K9AR51_9STAP|nr:DEAD/DEAH box helicase family protein [Staphylococcus massiliensis]EKU48516.1 putative ATP-dependent helicase [Staphylococcus massiliensis S46]